MPAIRNISIVDDDRPVREAVESLVKAAGYEASAFGSAKDFLDSGRLQRTDCLIVDVRMPGMSGLDLQETLASSGVPIIFISAHGDEEARERALQGGAVDFLRKPFSDGALLAAIDAAGSRNKA